MSNLYNSIFIWLHDSIISLNFVCVFVLFSGLLLDDQREKTVIWLTNVLFSQFFPLFFILHKNPNLNYYQAIFCSKGKLNRLIGWKVKVKVTIYNRPIHDFATKQNQRCSGAFILPQREITNNAKTTELFDGNDIHIGLDIWFWITTYS